MMCKIPERATILNKIFTIKNEDEFNKCALSVFLYQYNSNTLYKKFIDLLRINPLCISHYKRIPFLPIDFFRLQNVGSCIRLPERIFLSSGTTLATRSRHYIYDLEVYNMSIYSGFKMFYGDPADYFFITLLPSTQNAPDSSLVYMTNKLKEFSGQAIEANYPFLYNSLKQDLSSLKSSSKKVMLIGVTYALMDFSEVNSCIFPDIIFMETGGMKGKRPEITRQELHKILKKSFGVTSIHSEYGMTELLSQAYSKGEGIFSSPPWMKILIRDANDPLSIINDSRSGGINVIDLANIDSCSFIATQDIGCKIDDNSFEIAGRFDFSDLRGCNLLTV